MKHFVPFLKAFVLVAFTFFYGNSTAQVGELSFSNPSLVSGSAGANGAVYRFPNVNATFDALVTIKGRSSSQVNLTSIDLTSTGFQKAFQPQIRWGSGSVSSAQSWWMEFEITFVNKGTSVATLVDELKVTALDIDGDNSRLNEWVAFHNTNMYKLEANSALNVSNLVHSGVVIGKRFDGIVKEHPG
ncbi:MAG TPA: hypothetical protein PKE63_10495, partial [Lacibacter sp.]|nr:hypothetical protein [Lacibacter sp.]